MNGVGKLSKKPNFLYHILKVWYRIRYGKPGAWVHDPRMDNVNFYVEEELKG